MDTTPTKSIAIACNLAPCIGDRFEFVHRLPRGVERHEKWLAAIQESGGDITNVKRICPRHFRPEDYTTPESRTLNRVAVPSLNLIDLSQLDKCRQTKTIPREEYRAIIHSPLTECTVVEEEEVDYKKIKLRIGVEDKERVEEAAVVEIDQSVDDEQNVFFTLEEIETTESFARSSPIDIGAEVQQQQHKETKCDIVEKEPSQVAKDKVSEPLNESNIKVVGRQLIVQHPDFEDTHPLDFNWLRDFCKCEECFNSTTGVRKLDLLAYSLNLEPKKVTLSENNMIIEWNNGHISTYSLLDIFLSQTLQDLASVINQTTWNARLANLGNDLLPINFNKLICGAITENAALDRLQRSGILIITELTTNAKQQPIMIELLLRRLFPHNYQRLVHEQRMDFVNAPHQQPHTNCSFLSESCGLQILSLCPTTNTTATFTCLDGFNAAIQMRAMARQSFDFLTSFKLPFVYRNVEENFDFSTEASVIEVLSNDSPKRINYAPYQRGFMPQQNLAKFTEALRKFTKIMQNENNHFKFSLRKDMLIILDNWRICWQVKAETAAKPVALNCTYVERKDFLSRLNQLHTDD